MKDHSKKLSIVLEHIINDDEDKARDLLHDVIVEKSRNFYSSLIDEDYDDLGGDPKDDFVDEIESDKNEIEADEMYDEKDEDEEGEYDYDSDGELDSHEEDHGDADKRIDDLEDSLGSLLADFDELESKVEDELDSEEGDSDEGEEEDLGDLGTEEDSEEEPDFGEEESDEGEEEEDPDVSESIGSELSDEELREATEFLKKIAVDMKKEGQGVGTGKDYAFGEPDTESPFSKPASKINTGTGAHDFTEGGTESEGDNKVSKPSDENKYKNRDVKGKRAPSPKKPREADNKKSPLGNSKRKG